jgi:hypothetical protein
MIVFDAADIDAESAFWAAVRLRGGDPGIAPQTG